MIPFDKNALYEKIRISRESNGVIYSCDDGVFYSTTSKEYKIVMRFFTRPVQFRSDEYWRKYREIEESKKEIVSLKSI